MILVTIFAYYSACSILRFYNREDFFIINLKDSLKSLSLGILVGLVPSILNVFEFYFIKKQQIVVNSNILLAAFEALNPAIFEEVLFRFFLISFVIGIFKGEFLKTKTFIIITYILLIVPHCLMHYSPSEFIGCPIKTISNLIYMCVVFGIPASWLMKNRNLYAVIGFHWFIDFIRFLFVKN